MSKHSDYQLLPVAYCGNCYYLATDGYVLLSLGEQIIKIMKYNAVPAYPTIIWNTKSAEFS